MTTITKEQAQKALERTEDELKNWQDAYSCALGLGLSEQLSHAASWVVYFVTVRDVLQFFLTEET